MSDKDLIDWLWFGLFLLVAGMSELRARAAERLAANQAELLQEMQLYITELEKTRNAAVRLVWELDK